LLANITLFRQSSILIPNILVSSHGRDAMAEADAAPNAVRRRLLDPSELGTKE
jgi:hypothetical protein